MRGVRGKRLILLLNRVYWWLALYGLLLLFVLGRRLDFPEIW
jgi:hypothetical protein